MKVFVLAVFLAVAGFGGAYSAPADALSELSAMWEEAYEEDDNTGVRQRRVTCDLLSFEVNVKGNGGKVNDAACAANCLSMGKAGGRCNAGICQCRKTNFKDLWDKRFG